MGRLICGWTDRLPESCRDAADEILVGAARAGARQEDLAGLAAEIYARSLPDPLGRQRPVAELRGPQGAGGAHVWRRGRPDRGPDAGVRGGGDRCPGLACRLQRSGGYPDEGPALP